MSQRLGSPGNSIYQVHTMEEMEYAFYGAVLGSNLQKADAPILTSTGGIYNPLYAAKIWSQLNMEANTFAMQPKTVWDHSGFRVLTARPPMVGVGGVTAGNFTVAPGGLADNSALPDTIKPTWLQLYSKPKTVGHTFNVSEMAAFLGRIDDGMGDMMRQMREIIGIHHAENINIMLNSEGLKATQAQEGNDIQSLDRIIASKAELDMKLSDGTSAAHADSLDVYVNGSRVDRSDDTNYSWADAIVNMGTVVNNANVLRALSLDIIDATFSKIWKAGGTPKVIQTGFDTLKAINRLLQAQQRFTEYKTIVPTYGGVKGIEGAPVGFMVSTYNGVPLIPTKDCLVDQPSGTPAGISRMYFEDTDYLTIKTARPTQYFEAGISTGNPFSVGTLGDKGLYRTAADFICNRFNVQAKIRDLKE